MKHRRRWILLALSVCALTLAAGCRSSGEQFPRIVALGEGEVFPAILNSSLAVGENRLVLQLLDADEEPISGASVHMRFFDLNGGAKQAGEADARFLSTETFFIDEQGDRSRTVTGEYGVYVAMATFARAGEWGMRIDVEGGGIAERNVPFRFNVLERSAEPMAGDAAPRSLQPTTSTVASIEEIDSSYPPRPQMHDTTIADAVTSGRPAVIAFATPAYCRTRTCGPLMESVMDPLYARYHAQATFIHVEPYVLRDLRAGFVHNPVSTTREWKLQSEPWIFVVDARGVVSAKFEGVAALDEVEAALLRVLPG